MLWSMLPRMMARKTCQTKFAGIVLMTSMVMIAMVFSQMLSCSFANIFKAFWFIVCLLLIVISLGHLACSSVRIHLNWTNPNCQHFSQSVEAAHAAARIAASWNCLARDRCKEVQPRWILCQTEKASSSTILEHLVHCSSACVQFYDLGDIFFLSK